MSMVSIAIMNAAVWNLVTGDSQFLPATNQFPENKIAGPINWLMRATISLMIMFLYGSFFRIQYKNGDVIYVQWRHFKYEVDFVYAADGIMVDSGRYLGSDW